MILVHLTLAAAALVLLGAGRPWLTARAGRRARERRADEAFATALRLSEHASRTLRAPDHRSAIEAIRTAQEEAGAVGRLVRGGEARIAYHQQYLPPGVPAAAPPRPADASAH